MPVTEVPSPVKSRVLIADDNPTNVELLEVYLSDVDCMIAVAVDGLDTLNKVDTFRPDLILLDIMMPKLSGFEVCKKLKSNPVTRGIMILMVTALNELPNGHILFGNCHAGPDNPQLIEVRRDKTVVWTFKDFKTFGNGLAATMIADGEPTGR